MEKSPYASPVMGDTGEPVLVVSTTVRAVLCLGGFLVLIAFVNAYVFAILNELVQDPMVFTAIFGLAGVVSAIFYLWMLSLQVLQVEFYEPGIKLKKVFGNTFYPWEAVREVNYFWQGARADDAAIRGAAALTVRIRTSGKDIFANLRRPAIDTVNQLWARFKVPDQSPLAIYKEELFAMGMRALRAAYWCHTGTAAAPDMQKHKLVEGIVAKVVASMRSR